MLIKALKLENFRNYADATVEFGGGVNVICGRNAQGKTNLIEAIWFLASVRAFRAASDREMIRLGESSARIEAEIISLSRSQTLEAKLFQSRRRELFAGGVKLKKTSELTGRLTAVLFCPDDLDMIKGGAQVRRKLLDSCLSQLRPRYSAALSEFLRLYEHKTRILRGYREKPSLLELLEDFNLRLAQQSALLIYYRAAFSAFLSQKAKAVHNEFCAGAETLEINYKTVGGIEAAGKTPDEILPLLLAHQRELLDAELKSGLCLSGAHKDDLDIKINGLPARKFASQGQARTAAVSIKLAERAVHYDDRGEIPVLLLDDVLSELDANRQSFLLGHIPDGQVFITCCDDSQLAAIRNGRVFYVENGSVCPHF